MSKDDVDDKLTKKDDDELEQVNIWKFNIDIDNAYFKQFQLLNSFSEDTPITTNENNSKAAKTDDVELSSSDVLAQIDSFSEEPSILTPSKEKTFFPSEKSNKDKSSQDTVTENNTNTSQDDDLLESTCEDQEEAKILDDEESKHSEETLPLNENDINSSNTEIKTDQNDDIDYSLLDENDDEDFIDSRNYDSLTVDELFKLYDDDSEIEDEAKSSDVAITLDLKFLLRKLRQWNKHYFEILRKVYQMYREAGKTDEPTPTVSFRIFFQDSIKDADHIIGFETMEEYVDSQHPMWIQDRQECFDILNLKENRSSLLAEMTRNKWKNRKSNYITSTNLSSFSRKNVPENNSGNTHNPVPKSSFLQQNKPFSLKDIQAKLFKSVSEMDIELVKSELLEKERRRLESFQSKSASDFNQNKKRQIDNEQQYDHEKVKRVLLHHGNDNQWSVQKKADAVYGAQELCHLNEIYYKEEEGKGTIPRSQVEEIIAMEEARSKMKNFYSDPVDEEEEQDNNDNEFLENY